MKIARTRQLTQKSLAGIIVALALIAASLSTAPAALAAAATPDLVVTGALPTFSSAGPVIVTVYADPSSVSVPMGTRIPSPVVGGPVAEQAASTTYVVDVPQTPELLAAATNGVVNLMVVASTATQMSNAFTSAVTVNAALGTLSKPQRRVAVSRLIAAGPMLKPVMDTDADAVSCGWIEISTSNNITARVGQLHVANTSTMIGTYQYTVQADSTVSIGENFNNGPFSTNGSDSVTNSLGGGGTDPHEGGWAKYVDVGFNYGTYNGYGCMAGHQKLQADSSNADPYDGTVSAPGNPWGTCHADPNGYAHVDPAADASHPGTWNADRSTAKSEDMSILLAYQFTGSTGFTSDINILWENFSLSKTTYVCGDQVPVQNSTVLYNDLS
jgi:hypothetical protein